MDQPAEQAITGAWRDHRPYLLDLAYRILGDIGGAEDAVQEAFSRLLRAPAGEIEDVKGWLIVTTSRICLDQARSARVRREQPADPADMARRAGGLDADPADRITLDDSVRLALLVMLERLSPAERVVFVLHDVFGMPFDEVAGTVGRSAPACRQLARRARQKIGGTGAASRFEVGPSEHRRVMEKFALACMQGNLDGLLEVLDPEVSGWVDLLPSRTVRGAAKVAANILRYWGRRATLVSHPVAAAPALLAFIDRELLAVLMLSVAGNKITEIHVLSDPVKIGFLRTQLAATGAPPPTPAHDG